MPNFDGRGPNGQGPRTGRGLGACDTNGNFDASKATNLKRPGAGRGMGRNAGQKLDGTGPAGQGPKTGRGLGTCDDNGNINPNENAKPGE